MKLTIERVKNGFVLTSEEGPLEKGEDPIVDQSVIEDCEDDELKSGEHLLFEVMDYFNFGGSKHDPSRLRVIREPRRD